MLKQKYKSFLIEGVFTNQVWMLIAFVLLISNLLLSAKMYGIDTAEKTIVHPVDLLEQYTVKGDIADPVLIQKLSEDFLRARFLYTPKTVVKQFDNIAKLFHPGIYGDKKSELDSEAAKIIRNDETSVFFPMSVHIKENSAYVEAEISGYLGKKLISKEVRTFEVIFRNSGGRLWIFNWNEVVPDSTGKSYLPADVQQGDGLESVRESVK